MTCTVVALLALFSPPVLQAALTEAREEKEAFYNETPL